MEAGKNKKKDLYHLEGMTTFVAGDNRPRAAFRRTYKNEHQLNQDSVLETSINTSYQTPHPLRHG